MKKVLAIVLALVMVCTLALAQVAYKSTKLGDEKTTTLEGKFNVLDMTDNTALLENAAKKITLTTHENDVYVTTDDETITVYYADKYVIGEDVYSAVDASAADYKLVNNGKVIAYLVEGEVETDAAVAKTVKYAKGTEIGCGDYEVAVKGTKLDEDVTVYVIDDEAYLAGGEDWAVLNGKFVAVDTEEVEVIEHGTLVVNTYASTAPDADVATVKCPDCKKVINVVKSIPVASADKYTMINLDGDNYYYLTAAADVTATTTTTTTNPDTGANDVIGVAAALAVVALVSGAAISLKK